MSHEAGNVINMVEGDTGPVVCAIKNKDGTARDMTSDTLNGVTVKGPNGTTTPRGAITDDVDGEATVTFVSDTLPVKAYHEVQLDISFGGGTRKTLIGFVNAHKAN